jgi:chromosome segregation ATPase
MATDPNTPIDALAEVLEAWVREIDGGGRLLLARSPVSYWLIRRLLLPPVSVVRSPEKLSSFTPSEAMLLASLTEKFYGSASFKALGIALAGAVLLAGSGIVYLGTQSINLHDSLNQTAETQQKSLKELGDRQRTDFTTLNANLQKMIEAQKTAISDQNIAIEQRYTQFTQHADAADAKITKSFEEFQTGSKGLEERAIQRAIAFVSDALNSQAKVLMDPIQHVANTNLTTINQNLTDAQKDIRDKQTAIAALGPQIEMINRQAQLVAQLPKDLDEAKKNVEAAAAASREATRQEAEARKAWESVGNLVKDLQTQLATQEAGLGRIVQRVSDQTTTLDRWHAVVERTESDRDKINTLLTKIRDELDARQKDLGAITQRVSDQKMAFDQEQQIWQQRSEQEKDTLSASQREAAAAQAARKSADDSSAASSVSAIQVQTTLKTATDTAAHIEDALKRANDAATNAMNDATNAQTQLASIIDVGSKMPNSNDLQARLTHVETLSPRLDSLEQKVVYLEHAGADDIVQLTGDKLQLVQRSLTTIGCGPLDADGRPGRKTTAAIRCYQNKRPNPPKIIGELTAGELKDLLQRASAQQGRSP